MTGVEVQWRAIMEVMGQAVKVKAEQERRRNTDGKARE